MTDWTCDSCDTIWAEGQRFCRFCDDPNAKITELEAKLAEVRVAELRAFRLGWDAAANGDYELRDQMLKELFALEAAREEKG